MTELAPILEAVRQAAQLCAIVQQDYLIRNTKQGREPVTIADYGSQAILCRAIQQAFPNDGIVAEEQGSQFIETVDEAQRQQIAHLVGQIIGQTVSEADLIGWLDHGRGQSTRRLWVIDPIDGTIGFLAKRHYTIAVGLLEDYQPIGGVMGCPEYRDGCVLYARDGVAFYEPLMGGVAVQVQVSQRSQPSDLMIVEGVETARVDQAAIQQVYQSLGIPVSNLLRADGQDKYAMIICGDGDLYLRIPEDHQRRALVWDHAAGVAILQAAGGKVTDVDGKPLNFAEIPVMHSTRFIIITNGHIHEMVLAALHQIDL